MQEFIVSLPMQIGSVSQMQSLLLLKYIQQSNTSRAKATLQVINSQQNIYISRRIRAERSNKTNKNIY